MNELVTKNKLLEVVLNEWDKYEDNSIILTRLINCINNLPEVLENTNTTIIEREKRKNKLEKESEQFIQKFLYNHKFYYHTTSELFFEYNDKNFSLVKEDDIQYTILTAISSNKTLMDWKQKLKVTILKKIKERDIFSCIPESETIQNVINKLHPSICDTKEKAKYFLTIIGDILLKKSKDENLKKYALYLKNNSENDIITHFTNNNVENSIGCSISWKNMQFLWKKFIDGERFQNLFFTSTLKNKLKENLKYDEEKDVFLDCTSKLLPTVSKFIKFWNDNMEMCDDINEEIEIDELCSLFTYHTKTNIDENSILDLIRHYYSDVFIDDDKYLLNTKCKLWNKKEDIINSLKKYKSITSHTDFYTDEIPITEMYQMYCGNKNKFTASKRYFEKFIKEESELYIIEDNFIKVESFGNI